MLGDHMAVTAASNTYANHENANRGFFGGGKLRPVARSRFARCSFGKAPYCSLSHGRLLGGSGAAGLRVDFFCGIFGADKANAASGEMQGNANLAGD
jgi:hypothetical protein